MRKLVGFVLYVGGGLLLSFAAGRYLVGAYRGERARQAWDDAEARAAVALVEADAGHHRQTQSIAEGAAVARLVIPRIGLDEVVLEGVGGDELDAAPGHMPGSALPGEPGNSIISAHRDRHFNHLDAVQVGDTIDTESGFLDTRWVVVGKRVLGRNAPALFVTSQPTLTLTTCWPLTYIGAAPDRLLITARPLAVPRAAAAPQGRALERLAN